MVVYGTKKVYWNGDERFILFKYRGVKEYSINQSNVGILKFNNLALAKAYLKLNGAR